MKMLMRKGLLSSTGRSTAMATIAVPAVTMSEPLLAIAGPPQRAFAASTELSDATDFSSVHRRRYYRGGGSAAGLAFFGMAIGTIGAQQQRYDYYNSYGYGPGYGGGPIITAAGHIMVAAMISLTSVSGRVF
jgi:hypothetical protein